MNIQNYNVYSQDGMRQVGTVAAVNCEAALKLASQRWYLPMVRAEDWTRPEPEFDDRH